MAEIQKFTQGTQGMDGLIDPSEIADFKASIGELRMVERELAQCRQLLAE